MLKSPLNSVLKMSQKVLKKIMNYDRLKKDYFSWQMPMQLNKKPSSYGCTSKFWSQTLSQGHRSLAFGDLERITKNFWYEWNFMFRIFNPQHPIFFWEAQIMQIIQLKCQTPLFGRLSSTTGHVSGIWICICSLFYRRQI